MPLWWECISCGHSFEWEQDSPVFFCRYEKCNLPCSKTSFRKMECDEGGPFVIEPYEYALKPREWWAKRVREEMHTITLYENGDMYYYLDGVYVKDPQGNHHRERLREMMGDRFNTNEVSEILNLMRADTFRDMSTFNDNDPYEVCMENGIINIKNGEFTEHSPTKYHLWKIPVQYDPSATCPVLHKFLSEILHPTDIDVVQEMMGYCLYGKCAYRKAFMLIGNGFNGKSVLLDFIIAMMGEQNVASIPLQKLEQNNFAGARLFGKAANICDELSKDALKKLDIFKKLVAGSFIDAEKKGKDGFDYYNRAKLLFATNNPPIMYDNSDGNWDRWIFLTFPNQFTPELGNRDVHLRDKLIIPSEHSGAVLFAIEGMKRVLANSGFSRNMSTDDTREYYVRMSDPLSAYCLDNVTYTGNPDDWVPKDEFYNAVTAWCKSMNINTPTKREIGARLTRIVEGTGKTTPEVNGRRVPSWKCITIDEFDPNEYVLRTSYPEHTPKGDTLEEY